MLSGTYGWVIIPDKVTSQKVLSLGEKYSEGFKGVLLPNPHLSIYHTTFENLPVEVVKKTGSYIKSNLLGKEITLKEVAPYGGKFLFWNATKPYSRLQKTHEHVVKELSKYIPRKTQSTAEKEGLKMKEQELENIKNYGHPLVNKEFLPHFSLLFTPDNVSGDFQDEEHIFKVTKVSFLEVMPNSQLGKVVEEVT